MKGSKICRYKNYRSFVLGIRTGFSPACLEFGLSGSLSFLFLNEEGKKSSAADQRMAVELAARNECSAEAGKLAARCSEHLYTPVQQKMQSTEEEAGELKEKCAYFQALVGVLENQVKNVRNEVEGQKADLAKLWEQIDGEMAAAKDLHDQEMAAVAARHAQEMVAAKDLHDQEMAAAAARHAQEMAAVKREYNLEYLESMGQPPAEDSPDSDTN